MAAKLLMFVMVLSLLLNSGSLPAQHTPGQFPGEKSTWNGFSRYDFDFMEKKSLIVAPETAAFGNPWIWRARFFGHQPQADLALLGKGFHLVYTDVADLYGNPEAVEHWNKFYHYMVSEFHFSPKVVLEGMSRGGLIVYNWATENPEKVACIYADNPVCNINSWPGGKGSSDGSPDDWKKCLEAWQINEISAAGLQNQPVHHAAKLAKAGIPVLHVIGTEDKVVPPAENNDLMVKSFRMNEGNIKVIAKEGLDHHPHSLQDPRPIVDFILENTLHELKDPLAPEEALRKINERGSLQNSYNRFQLEKNGRVAFLGGSITRMPGWRDQVCEYLEKKFQETSFQLINAGIPSTGSVPGAFRLSCDVFQQGMVDLLFIEAAVNDHTNQRTAIQQIRGMEGIIRNARRLNPKLDIVLMYFADPDKLKLYNLGEVPEVIKNHEKVAEHYGITSIDLAWEVTQRILYGEFSWKEDFKDLHPSAFGHNLYFKSIRNTLENGWSNKTKSEKPLYNLPEPLDTASYFSGSLIPANELPASEGFRLIKNWVTEDGAATREGFHKIPVLQGLKPGDRLNLPFSGNAIGIFTIAGPDAGSIRYKIDSSPWQELDLFTAWSQNLHLPWLYLLGDNLSNGKHRLTIEITDSKNPLSKGNACRIGWMAVNNQENR